jgi:hypothetical protein
VNGCLCSAQQGDPLLRIRVLVIVSQKKQRRRESGQPRG